MGAIAAVALGLVTALFAFNYRVLVPATQGGEFLTLWAGSRAFLFEGTDPYGGSVPARVQKMVYGRPARAGEEPFILDVPFHLLMLFFPLALVSDPVIARSMYTVVLELGLAAAVYMSVRLAGLSRRPLQVAFAGTAILSFYSSSALAEASPSPLLACLYLGVLWTITAGRYELGGALLVLGSLCWELGGPFLVMLGIHAFRRGGSRVWIGAALLGILLLAVSLFPYPDWFIPLWRAVANNLRWEYGFTLAGVLARVAPALPGAVWWAPVVGLVFLIALEVRRSAEAEGEALHWSSLIVLAATPLLGQRGEIENLAPLLFAWPFVLRAADGRWGSRGGAAASLLMTLVFLAPWGLNSRGNEPGGLNAGQWAFLLLPGATLLALYWMRWWALHAPRSWTARLAQS